jgi:drug/metabolite transporter (DMT)-like permease
MPIPLLPFAASGAVSEATATVIEKNILRKRKVEYKSYTVWGFLVISLLMALIVWKFWKISPEAFQLKNVLIMLSIIVFASLANLLTFYAMKWEKITEMEPLRLFQPLFVVILAFILYSSERSNPLPIIIASLIACLALVFSHIRKHHFKLNKYLTATLLGSLFFAIELVASKAILPYYSSLTFYFIRCSLIFIITLIILRPSPSSIDKKSWIYIIISSAIWILYRMLLYYGYNIHGIIFTTTLFILGPIFIYIFASIFLKEKWHWKNIVSAIIILACVAYVILK